MNILLVDLSSIAHPLFHTSASDPDPNATSTKTVARVRALASGQPHTAVCCDSGRSFRRDISETYKANRPPSDATLQHQITLAMETLRGDGFPVWAVKGFEADDLIATAVYVVNTGSHPITGHRYRNEDQQYDVGDIVIASADKDLLQLVGPRVTVHSLTSGNTFDADAVQAKLGVTPEQVVDYLSLVGDSSDNIKGVPGIGAKTAAELLKKYGTLEDLYAALTKNGTAFTPARATALREFESRMAEVRSLITLRTDVPLPFEELFQERVPQDVAVFRGDEMTTEPETLAEAQAQAETLEPHEITYVQGTIDRLKTLDGGRSAQATDRTSPQADNPVSPDSRAAAVPPSQQDSALRQAQNDAARKAEQRYQAERAKSEQEAPASTAIAPVEFERQLEPRDMRQAHWIATQLHQSRLFSAYGNPAAVLSTILAGRELNIPAMASLRGFHIIEGKPTMAADLIRALVMRSAVCEYFRCTERTAQQATFVTKRKGDPEIALTFTVTEGRAAWPKDDKSFAASGWGKNPADMCVARASSKLARLVYPEIVHGFYAPEEMD